VQLLAFIAANNRAAVLCRATVLWEREAMAAIPRVLFAVPGILAGILVPTVIVAAPKPTPPNTVGMTFMDFTKDTVYLHPGQYLTFVDSSRNIHEIGPGQNGHVTSPVRGEPMTGIHLMQTNTVYKTGPWLTSGTFYVTCAVHPMMNLTVVVLP
jgi:plastocyanin